MISDNRKNLETFPDLDYMMLQNYMRRQGVIIKGLDGRIQVVY